MSATKAGEVEPPPSSPLPPTPEKSAPSIVHRTGKPFYVPANFDVAEDILGRGFTRGLRDVDSATGKKIGRVYQTPLTTIQANTFKTSLEEVNDSMQLGLAASYFGFEASAKHHSSSRFALLTAYHVDKIVKIDDSADPPPNTADIVATEVIYGWCLTYWFEGQATGSDFGASLRALGMGGKLDAEVEHGRIQQTFKSTGLKPKHAGSIPIILKAEDVLTEFTPDGDPKPILVKYVAVRDLKSTLLQRGAAKTACEGDGCITDAWIQRATTAMKGLLKNNSEQIAATIQAVGHPSGGSPSLSSVTIERSAHGIAVKMACDWTGAFGGANTTTVRWEVGPGRSVAIRFFDNATFSIAQSNGEQLAEYFNKTLFDSIAAELQP